MKKILLALLMVAAITPFSSQAQDMDEVDFSWCDNAPERYSEANTKLIISPTSPCNTNGEAFKDFIPRFRTDKSFRESRLKLSTEMERSMFVMLGDWTTGYNIIKARQKNTRCDKSFGTWFDVTATNVSFAYDDVLLCSDFGGSSLRVRFTRIDGKWYCTGIMMAG